MVAGRVAHVALFCIRKRLTYVHIFKHAELGFRQACFIKQSVAILVQVEKNSMVRIGQRV